MSTTNCFVQWKGTDVCMDFYCDCGFQSHFDGFFAYNVRCPGCGQVWEIPSTLYPRKQDDPDPGVILTKDGPE